MLKRYQILSNCLSELRKSDIRTIDRLQVEVALYSLKMVLLGEEELLRDPCDEPEFETIVQMGRSICTTERTTIEVQKFIMYLNEIKEMILIRSGATG